jgi:hypothetical protein
MPKIAGLTIFNLSGRRGCLPCRSRPWAHFGRRPNQRVKLRRIGLLGSNCSWLAPQSDGRDKAGWPLWSGCRQTS